MSEEPLTDEADEADEEAEGAFRRLPRRDAQAKQALLAIALVFFVGIAIGYFLAKGF